jgi:hypothetical protein
MLEATMYLTAAANQLQQDNMRRMSDEELAETAARQMIAMIQQHPKLVMDVAEQIGWQVVPPSAAQHSSGNADTDGDAARSSEMWHVTTSAF